MRRLATLVLLVGCNQVFDLERPERAPPVPPDRDGDLVLDEVDNCPDDPNESQSDDDRDGRGDICDNCPLVSNYGQERIGDADKLGDVCDPHPVHDGDCLILYDSFADPAAFAAHWTTEATQGAPIAEPGAGSVTLVPPASGTVAMFALDRDGQRLAGLFDVQLVADVTSEGNTARVAATANTTLASGFRCWLETNSLAGAVSNVHAQTATMPGSPWPMSSRAVGTETSIRLVSVDPSRSPHLRCQINFGVALGTAEIATPSQPTATSVGALAAGQRVRIDGIAVTRYEPGVACPEAIVR